MTKSPVTTAKRLASLREAIEAANGDWHEATALWSVQNDVQWLLDNAEAAGTPPVAEPPLDATSRRTLIDAVYDVWPGLAQGDASRIADAYDARLRALASGSGETTDG